MKKFLFICLFFLNAFPYEFKITAPSDAVKIFDAFDYTIEFHWNSNDDVSGVDFTDKDALSDFEIISYKDEQSQDFKKDGLVEYLKVQTYRLHPTKIGAYTIKAPQVQIIKKDASAGETLNGEEKKINVIGGFDTKKFLRYGVILVLACLLVLFVLWLIYHFIRKKKAVRKEIFEKEVATLYRNELKARFSNDFQKKALVIKDFLEQNKIRAKEKKIELFDKTFWRFIEASEIEKMEDDGLKSYIKEIEKRMKD